MMLGRVGVLPDQPASFSPVLMTISSMLPRALLAIGNALPCMFIRRVERQGIHGQRERGDIRASCSVAHDLVSACIDILQNSIRDRR